MALLKTDVPRFREGERLRDQVDRLRGYLEDLQSALNFVLSNLSGENFNGKSLSVPVWSADGKTRLGTIGAMGNGVGMMSGLYGLRVSDAGIEKTTDGGKTWAEV